MGQTRRLEETSSDQVTSGCSHGPVGRIPAAKGNTDVDRPQAGGYNIYEFILFTLAQPPHSSSARNAPAAWRFVSIGRFSFPAGTIAERIGRRQE
jgi:hypothetical protein